MNKEIKIALAEDDENHAKFKTRKLSTQDFSGIALSYECKYLGEYLILKSPVFPLNILVVY